MDKIQNGWFSEISEQWPGQALSLRIEEVLYQAKSKYQEILVFRRAKLNYLFKSGNRVRLYQALINYGTIYHHTKLIGDNRQQLLDKSFGNILVLDGVIQCSEKDECSYQEMISFLPLNSHPNPRKVLVIGGGDGGVIREVVKLPCVESVMQCEIDEDVIEVSKKYLPKMAKGYDSPKLTVHIGDGYEFLKDHENEFDVIITDTSDPIDTSSPAESLFQTSFYEVMQKALKPNGIFCCQEDCMWAQFEAVRGTLQNCGALFPVCSYGYVTTPTYPYGQIAFVLCSKNEDTKFNEPVRVFTDEEMDKLSLQFYNVDVHRAAFAWPQFLRKELSAILGS